MCQIFVLFYVSSVIIGKNVIFSFQFTYTGYVWCRTQIPTFSVTFNQFNFLKLLMVGALVSVSCPVSVFVAHIKQTNNELNSIVY
jgi:hypothetical protein